MMKKQAFNPYLPSFEYVPDGEPRLFGGRVYVYGSHDEFNGDDFCTGDYVCWSAPADDLGDWRYEGVIFKKTQEPGNDEGKMLLFAPDVVQGPDGRYYLYYQPHMSAVTSVAVCDTPAGQYEFYGHVHTPEGRPYSSLKGDANSFDPGVLIDDDGSVFLYTGFSPNNGALRKLMSARGFELNGSYCIELEQDMVTMKSEPKLVIPGETAAGGTDFEGHGFFEASSPRKINGRYYLVYSSCLSHELCYAVSDKPDEGYVYGGTLVSIGDIGYKGNTEALNYTGNTHGGLVQVNEQWYIFYHRQTNKQKCCRQGCAEKVYFNEDGSIPQVEMTSCGLNDGPLSGSGEYEARIACNLGFTEPAFGYLKTREKDKKHPFFTQSGGDREDNGDQYIANMRSGAWAGYKYFDFRGESRVSVTVRGTGEGTVYLSTEKGGRPVGRVVVRPSGDWRGFKGSFGPLEGVKALYLTFEGTGAIDLMSFTLSR